MAFWCASASFPLRLEIFKRNQHNLTFHFTRPPLPYLRFPDWYWEHLKGILPSLGSCRAHNACAGLPLAPNPPLFFSAKVQRARGACYDVPPDSAFCRTPLSLLERSLRYLSNSGCTASGRYKQ